MQFCKLDDAAYFVRSFYKGNYMEFFPLINSASISAFYVISAACTQRVFNPFMSGVQARIVMLRVRTSDST